MSKATAKVNASKKAIKAWPQSNEIYLHLPLRWRMLSLKNHMRYLLVLIAGSAVLLAGCGQKGSTSSGETSTPETPASTNLAAMGPADDAAATLDSLTQAVRKFGAEKQRIPSSLDEVVAAGYIKTLPQAPPGKKFSIDTRRMVVFLE